MLIQKQKSDFRIVAMQPAGSRGRWRRLADRAKLLKDQLEPIHYLSVLAVALVAPVFTVICLIGGVIWTASSVYNAWRAELSGIHQRLDKIETKLTGIEGRLDEVVKDQGTLKTQTAQLTDAVRLLSTHVRMPDRQRLYFDAKLPVVALRWGNRDFRHPAPAAACRTVDTQMVCAVSSDTQVVAMAGGKLTRSPNPSGGERVEIALPSGNGKILYRDLAEVSAKAGETVRAGSVIGQVRMADSDPFQSRFSVEFVRGGEPVAPPSSIPMAYRSEGHRIYATRCAACHKSEKLPNPLIQAGHLPSGAPATDEQIRKQIENGGIHGMRGLGLTIGKPEIDSVIRFLREGGSQPDPPLRSALAGLPQVSLPISR
ncbi:MAG: c-type cytochrome [Bryobacteraceae bacterium]